MTTSLVAVTGNTFPVKDQIKALGGRWNADQKAWMVPADKADAARALVSGSPAKSQQTSTSTTTFKPRKCVVCGAAAWNGQRGSYSNGGVIIYRSGECQDCFEERKMGY
jgi:hypothetical protein